MDVTVLVEPEPNLEQIARVQDELGHEGRVHTAGTWGKKEQALLFEAAKGHRPLTLEHFVPGGTSAMTEVIHEGRNTLFAFNQFQKRFFRSEDEDGEELDGLVQALEGRLHVLHGPRRGRRVALRGPPGVGQRRLARQVAALHVEDGRRSGDCCNGRAGRRCRP